MMIFTFWALIISLASVVGVILAIAIKRYRNICISLITFGLSYFLWQIAIAEIYDFSLYIWLLALIALTILAIVPIVLNVRYSKTRITPLAIKYGADKMECGVCYWYDNGHVVFCNNCMNDICISLMGKPLVNGNVLNNVVLTETQTIGENTWQFARRDVEFNKATLHELIAFNVTEIYEKTEELKQSNEELASLNEQLKTYNLKIDNTVKEQEILNAKINIHDEMNRLMLESQVTDIENEVEINRIFSMWEQNALLLCLEADKKENASEKLEKLATALGVSLKWDEEMLGKLSANQRELLLVAASEAMTNAVKHGMAKDFEISCIETDSEICCRFANDGKMPQGEFKFSGGLANLDVLARKNGASLGVEVKDKFILSLTIHK